MDVLDAVSAAKNHILKFFEDERILNLGLQEAFFDESQGAWQVTLGFSRSWDNPQVLAQTLNPSVLKREYKIVDIPENDKKEISIRNYRES
ncbi:MAG: hypothetical protein ACREC0_15245 [Methylocella sp.]